MYTTIMNVQARANIPTLSVRTIERGIKDSDFTIGSDVQVMFSFFISVSLLHVHRLPL